MKKHLTLETFERSLKTYVHGLNEISSLEILTYVIDVQENNTETKIDIDIPTVETEWQGKRLDTTGTHLIPVIIGGRLYLFIPHIAAKTKMEMDMTTAASLLNTVAASIDGLVGPLCAIPEIETMGAPMGVGASVTVGGQNIAMATLAGSTYLKIVTA
ncbi:hypothetical protein CDV31_012057 [Fusarium ambrosium]|uniref:Neuraminidase-like domain-containing protein n=1 Tax=Fusarium ambrosium TaxID=131363 RepID=A0A428TCP4_9HYPO|nr:hypothetical protein CDV31_012057 [Fusarium ambrosium]